jgi:hypothetical protein
MGILFQRLESGDGALQGGFCGRSVIRHRGSAFPAAPSFSSCTPPVEPQSLRGCARLAPVRSRGILPREFSRFTAPAPLSERCGDGSNWPWFQLVLRDPRRQLELRRKLLPLRVQPPQRPGDPAQKHRLPGGRNSERKLASRTEHEGAGERDECPATERLAVAPAPTADILIRGRGDNFKF